MKAVVHIGMEKTGSTTIQEFLHLNRAALARQQIAVPQSPGLRNHRSLATYCIPVDHADDHATHLGLDNPKARENWRQAFHKRFCRELDGLPPDTHTLLLSSEHLQSRLGREAGIRRLQSLLKPYVDTVEILVYLRRQDEAAVSRYSTVLRSGQALAAVIPPAARKNPFYHYLNIVDRWASVFGEDAISVRVFARGRLENGDLLQDFASAAGIALTDDLRYPEQKNAALSAAVQDMLLIINQTFPRYTEQGVLSTEHRAIRAAVVNRLGGKYPGRPRLPSRDEAREFYRVFEKSNGEVARKYLNTDTLFSADFSHYPEQAAEAHIDRAVVEDAMKIVAEHLPKERRGFRFSLKDLYQMLAQKIRKR